MVESEVRQRMRRPIRKILNLLSVVKFGQPFDIAFDFKPLRIMSSVEEETVKTSKQNRILQNYDKGMLSPQETAQALEKEKLISGDTAVAQGMDPTPPVVPGQEPGGGFPGGDKGDDKSKGDDKNE
jgi:hypothetical protein